MREPAWIIKPKRYLVLAIGNIKKEIELQENMLTERMCILSRSRTCPINNPFAVPKIKDDGNVLVFRTEAPTISYRLNSA